MTKKLYHGRIALLVVAISLFLSACTKEKVFTEEIFASKIPPKNARIGSTSSSTCIEDVDYGNYADSIDRSTILGYHLINQPDSLVKMQQAYQNITGSSAGVAITHKYVRFKPSSIDQLSELEDMDFDLWDYPLDYEVLQEGDYYNDGVTPAEEIPWLYTVVPASTILPNNITTELLQQIHVPDRADVENEAFRITGNPVESGVCDDGGGGAVAAPSSELFPPCPTGYHWDFSSNECVQDECPPGYYRDVATNLCKPYYTPPPPEGTTPTGGVFVWDTQEAGGIGAFVPMRKARVIAKNFLKINRVFTDNAGQYTLTKKYRKAHLILKMKNPDATVRAVIGYRLWQIIQPIAKNFWKI